MHIKPNIILYPFKYLNLMSQSLLIYKILWQGTQINEIMLLNSIIINASTDGENQHVF